MTKRELADDEIPSIDETFATDADYDPDGRYTAANLASDIRRVIDEQVGATRPDVEARLRLIEAIHKHLADYGL